MGPHSYDIVIVGGGTAGAFAAATAADEGLRTVILERKSREEAGDIACGDAIKGKQELPTVMDTDYVEAESFTNREIRRAIFENPADSSELEVQFDKPGTVLDRRAFGTALLEEASRAGAEIHYDTVVRDVVQSDGKIQGVTAVRDGSLVTYDASVTIDAAGALSILQDNADFSASTFDTNVDYTQFCSAYREIVEVPDEIEWSDALVFKPTEELGYLWYFPRSSSEINAGLGFQMNKPPVQLVDALKRDLNSRPEFDDAVVTSKLGAALPTRRPYDSAVAPGYVAAGDAAGHVNPTTGGGIVTAAKSAVWCTRQAISALEDGTVSEANLWEYNRKVMTNFGARFAAADLYNIAGGALSVEALSQIVAKIPGDNLVDVLGSGTSKMGLGTKAKLLFRTVGHWDTIFDLYRVQKKAAELREHYGEYPASPSGLEQWANRRDDILADVYEITGAEPKY
ncbi:geranylgeranyl reductase [Haloferax larsenii JCM 13917]|nr:geranylgeranyl reductase family protein [Haloferax larsenii]ELZ79706.1 geranylgeranyl reductase [Haloferax larsenii JCM 13917]